MTFDNADEVLAHYGVKGMKWGVRRNRSSSKPAASEDATRASEFAARAKKGGSKTLSNKELQDLVTRMNLEQQYARLQPPSKKSKAAKFVVDLLANAGKQQLNKVASDQAAKLVAGVLAGK